MKKVLVVGAILTATLICYFLWPLPVASEQEQLASVQEVEMVELPKLPSLNSELEKYLQSKNSPLADYADLILRQPHWKRIVAITAIESQYCKRKLSFNCWGIGGDSAYRHYKSYEESIVDANRVMEKYKNQSYKQMDGVYVQPYSANWLSVTLKADAELESLVTRTGGRIDEDDTLADKPVAH